MGTPGIIGQVWVGCYFSLTISSFTSSCATQREVFPDEVKLRPENIGRCSEFTIREMETLRFRDNTLTIVKKR